MKRLILPLRRTPFLYCLLILLANLVFGLPATPINAGEEYITLQLDQRPEERSDILCPTEAPMITERTAERSTLPAGSGPQPSGRAVKAGDEVRAIRIYSFGKPLQVHRSYVESRDELTEPWRAAACQNYSANAPQLSTSYDYSWSSSEFINRYYAGLFLPFTESWSGGITLRTANFTLKEDADLGVDWNGDPVTGSSYRHSDLTELDLQAIYAFSPEWNMGVAILAGGTDDLITPGARASAGYAQAGGIVFGGETHMWIPWGDNTLTALNNGRSNGVTLQSALPLRERLQLSFSGAGDWRYLASSAFSADSYQGVELIGQSRLTYLLFGQERRSIPVLFRSDGGFAPGTTTTGLSLFSNLLAGSYFDRPEESVVTVTEHRFEQRFGLEASAALSSRLAARTDAYVGYDTERNINFGKLYGFSSRLECLPTPWLRAFGTFGMDSEAATGITEGKTWRYGGGLDLKF